MKVLYVSNMYPTEQDPVFGIFVKEQIDDLAAAGVDNFDLYFINARQSGKWAYLRSIFAIPRRIREGNYDIIHIHYGLAALFLLFFRPRARVFLTLHGADILEKQGKTWQVKITKKALERVDRAFILNAEMESIVQQLGIDYEILPCGVNTRFFQPTPRKRPANDDPLIVFPSDPATPVKNFPLFTAVLEKIRQGAAQEAGFACVKELSRAGVRDLLNRADCLLMTSISEGSPQILKEALACGLPVVSVPVGDVPQMLGGIPHCYVSRSTDPTELAQLVKRTLGADRPAIREAFIAKGIYDSEAVTRRLLDHYEINKTRSLAAH